MKKLYSLVLAAAVALSASAAAPATADIAGAELRTADASVLTARTASKLSAVTSRADADYTSYTWKLLGTGIYKASVVADTYGTSTEPADVQIYEAEGHAGFYKVTGVWSDILDEDGVLYVDATNPDFVVVPKQTTLIEDNVDGITYIASQTYVFTVENGYDAATVSAAVPELVPVLKDGIINFPVKSLVLQWPEAPANSEYETDPESWYVGKTNGYLALPGAEVADPWTFYGKGTFTDGILSPSIGLTAQEAVVDVYVATDDETQFKIVDPWKAAFAQIGITEESPALVLDATDPDNILIAQTATGLGNSTNGAYSIFSESWYAEITGGEPEEPGLEITLTKAADKTTIHFPVHSCTLFTSTTQKFYYAVAEATDIVIDTTAAGIEGVTVSDANAPVEYFNLQGVRVANPESGLFIRRQGATTSKVLVK